MSQFVARILAELDDAEAKQKIEKLINEKKKLKIEIDDSDIKDILDSLSDIQKKKIQIKTDISNNKAVKGLGSDLDKASKGADNLDTSLKNVASTTIKYEAIRLLEQQVKEAVTQVKALDDALTLINQTMLDMPDSNLKQLGEDSLQMAKDLSIATQTITDAVTIYANASESASSILNKAQPTALLAAASGMSASKSADTIQGILNQFDMTDTQAMHVADSIEKLSSEIAVDFSKGISTISDAVSVSGSVMNEAGLSFEKYGAIVSAVTEETRSSGSVLGNAFKTIASRITRSKDGDVNSEDVANAEKAYNSLGINIRQTNGEFQDLSVTLDELHKVWGGLNNDQKSYIAEQSAGLRGKNTFISMMNTYSRALELEQSALNSSGTAMKINEVRMDSIDGKMQKLSATMTDIYNDTLSSDTVKGMLDLSQNILDVVDSLGLMKSALVYCIIDK